MIDDTAERIHNGKPKSFLAEPPPPATISFGRTGARAEWLMELKFLDDITEKKMLPRKYLNQPNLIVDE